MALRLLRALPGVPGLLAPVASSISAFRPQGRNRVSTRLDSSVGESGPHGLTVRFGAHHLTHQKRPSHPASRLVTIGLTSSCRGGTAWIYACFRFTERRIFLRGALDSSGKTGGGFFASCPSCRIKTHLSPRAWGQHPHLLFGMCQNIKRLQGTRGPVLIRGSCYNSDAHRVQLIAGCPYFPNRWRI